MAMAAAAAIMLPTMAEAVEETAFSGGAGTAAAPYVITTADQLNEVRNHLTGHFVLAADIDLGASAYAFDWTPIGKVEGESASSSFRGTFHGQGHTISGLRVSENTSLAGLFGQTSGTASISDLTLADAEVVNESNSSGVLVGRNEGSLSRVTVIDSSVTGQAFAGLVAGSNSGGTITESQAIGGSVVGYQDTGGVAGTNNGSLIGNRVVNATVSGTSPNVGGTGGIVGYNGTNGVMERNAYISTTARVTDVGYNTGGLAGYNYGTVRYGYAEGLIGIAGVGGNVGGLVGKNVAGGVIEDSYARSTVEGSSRLGGLVGENEAGATIARTYADAIFPTTSGAGLVGIADGLVEKSFWRTGSGSAAFGGGSSTSVVVGLDAAQLAQQSTFAASDWDFTNVWQLADGEDSPALVSWLGSLEGSVDGVAAPLYFSPYRYSYILNVPDDAATVSLAASKRTVSDTVYVHDQPADTLSVELPMDADHLAVPVVVHRDGQSMTYVVDVYRASHWYVPEVDFSLLESAIGSAAEALGAAVEGEGNGQHAAADIAAFGAAIAAAMEVRANAEASQTDVDAAIAALAAAAEAFAEAAIVVDRSALAALLDYANVMLGAAVEGEGAGQYAAADIAALEAAISAAGGPHGDPLVSQSVLDAAFQQLAAAVDAFIAAAVEVDREALEAAIVSAEAALEAAVEGEGTGQYRAADIAAFASAIAAAGGVHANPAASQSELNEAFAALAMAAAVFADAAIEVDRSVLAAAIASAEAVLGGAVEGEGAGQYAAADIASFEAAIAAASVVHADALASQSELDAALEALQRARDAFEHAAVGAVLTFAEEIVEAGQSYLVLTFNHPVSGVADVARFALTGAGGVTVTEASVDAGDARKVKAVLSGPLPASGAITAQAQAGAVTIGDGTANPAASAIRIMVYGDTLELRQQLLTYGETVGEGRITIAHVAAHANVFLEAMEQSGIDRRLLLRYLLRQIESGDDGGQA